MDRNVLVFCLVAALVLLCSERGFPEDLGMGISEVASVAGSSSGSGDSFGMSGWQSTGTAMSSMESTGSSTSQSGDQQESTGQTGGAWESFGWVPQGDGSWARTASEPSASVETQTGNWWDSTIVGSTAQFSLQGSPTTTLAKQWSVDSAHVSAPSETNTQGQTRSVTTWDTTNYGLYNTMSGARLDGMIATEQGDFKNFGQFQTTQTYPSELLTPSGGRVADTSTGNPGKTVDTGEGVPKGTVALGSAGSGVKTINIPGDAADPSAAGKGGGFAKQMDKATAAAGEPADPGQQMEKASSQTVSRDVAKKQDELIGAGQTGMTVDPKTGNAVPLKELSQDSAFQFDGQSFMESLAAKSHQAFVSGERPVMDTGKTEQPMKFSLESYTLTQEDIQRISSETRLLGEITVDKSAFFEQYTAPQLLSSEQKTLSVKPQTSYGEWKNPVSSDSGDGGDGHSITIVGSDGHNAQTYGGFESREAAVDFMGDAVNHNGGNFGVVGVN